MKIQESAEDYLESILILQEQKGVVRSIDVVRYLGYSKPSVSRAMGLLRQNGYITVDQDGFLALTDSGMAVAGPIYERHRFLTRWLEHLGVSPETAARDACRMEHSISDETFERMKQHISEKEGSFQA